MMTKDPMAKVHEDYSKHYDRLSDLSVIYERLDYSDLIELLPEKRDAAILDLGCGQGQVLYYLRANGYDNLTGVDQSTSQLSNARKHLANDVEIHDAEANTFLETTTKRFEVVILFDVLEHVPKEKITDFLVKIASKLSDSGKLIIRTPNMASPLGIYSLHIDFTHEIGFTETSLRQLLNAVGFKNVEFHAMKPKSLKMKLATFLHHRALRLLYRIEARSMPKMLDKNLLVVAE